MISRVMVLWTIEEHVVDPAAEGTSKERGDNRDLNITISETSSFRVLCEEGEERTVTGLPTEAGADAEDDEEEGEGREGAGAEIGVVFQGEDHEHEDGAGDEFREELARLGHEGGWVGAEDPGCCVGRVTWDGADTGATFVDVDGGFVVAVDDCCAAHGAEDLGDEVDREFSPGEFAQDAAGEGYGGVDVRA
ncbi:unnamed protein product [Aspergillus oryzae var. brunneus]|uniref:Unnamed protein product n=1 Tax=Aspergillus oryzae var. brunneus TaxID=332754 RepID=A0ABQ6KTY2_ASPOZ|nr:unnamed protein product [Aspergillus oryzae]GMG48906.1 unnamed protein product [Aspergillus oryzae var. brunneus]